MKRRELPKEGKMKTKSQNVGNITKKDQKKNPKMKNNVKKNHDKGAKRKE